MQGFVEQTLNGLTFAGLLFLLGSGFTLISVPDGKGGSVSILGGASQMAMGTPNP